MSGIVLSASVRQNLLSLQSRADLLATTQNRLSTGKKVNTALDNPTNYFTAQGLDSRASDISNLLDGIGNGVQVLQAANTGITSLQKLVDSAKSIANQVLQTTVGYSPKSNVTSAAITGATATNLLGPGTNSSVTATAAVLNDNTGTAINITGATLLSGTAGAASNDLASNITTGDTLVVNGTTFTFVAGATSTGTSIGVGDSVGHLLAAIDAVTGTSVASSVSGGKVTLNTGTTSNLVISGSALAKIGLVAGTTALTPPALSGETLTIGATGGGTATSITFGTGAGQISTLNQLNTALAANNLQATLDSSTGKINIVTSNDAASYTIGTIGGTATAFSGTPPAPVADPTSQAARASLVAQYNNVLTQINTTSQDASFNRINLLHGDTLKLTVNATAKPTLNIQRASFNIPDPGLSTLTAGTDFLDNSSANKALTTLTNASTTLRSEASSLGSNLSIVQIRQSFSKNLINVLQTGSSNLTLADTTEEPPNTQPLSPPQHIPL